MFNVPKVNNDNEANKDPLQGCCIVWTENDPIQSIEDGELYTETKLLESFINDIEEGREPANRGTVWQFHKGKYEDITEYLLNEARERCDLDEYEHRYGRG